MSAFSYDDPALLLSEREIDLLRPMIGTSAPEIFGTCIDVRTRDGVVKFSGGCHLIDPRRGGFLTISDEWRTTSELQDFHNLRVAFQHQPDGIEAEFKNGSVSFLKAVNHVSTKRFIGHPVLIRSIEVLSFESEEPQSEELLVYDRALRFELDDGFLFVLTTEQGPIMGGIDFKEGRDPAFANDQGRYRSRVSLH